MGSITEMPLIETYRKMVGHMKLMGLTPGNEEIRMPKTLKARLFPDLDSITIDGFTLPIIACDWVATHNIYIVITEHFKQNLKAMGIKARIVHYIKGLLEA